MAQGGWLKRLTGPIQALVKRDDPLRYIQVLPFDAPAGVSITMDTALQISVVWACVMAITNAVSVCEWKVLTKTKGKYEQLPDDPVGYLLNVRPNSDMSAIGMREATLINALTWGNMYWEIVRDLAGRVVELWPLLPHRCVPRRDWETGELYYDYYQQDGAHVRLEADDVYHLHGPGITGLMGDNLVARAVKSFALAEAQTRFASTYFQNNTVIGGYIKYPKTMDDKTYSHFRESWKDRHGGVDKAHLPAVLEGGSEFIQLQATAEHSQLNQSREFTVEDICRWYGVPPHKVQHLLRATFNNIEHLSIEFVRDACLPWAKRMTQEADYKLFARRSLARHTIIDMVPLTQGDFKTRMEGYAIGLQNGIYSINEVRSKEGENGIGSEGDARFVPLNMQSLDRLVNPPFDQVAITAGIPTVNEARERLKLGEVDGGEAPANQLKSGAGATSHNDDEHLRPAPVAPQLPPGAGEKPGKKTKPAPDDASQEPEAEPPAQLQAPTFVAAERLVSEATQLNVASILDRYGRRQHHRAEDLRRGGADDLKLRSHLADLRQQLRPKVNEECLAALSVLSRLTPSNGLDRAALVLQACDAVDAGQDPSEVAYRLVTAVLHHSSRLQEEACPPTIST